MTLLFVKPTPEFHINVLAYGAAKAGKSMGAATAPGPILYLNADRANATRSVHARFGEKINEVLVTGLDTLSAATFAAESGDYATVVLDPVGEVHRVLLEEASGRAVRPKIQEYGDVVVHLERFCRHMIDLPVNFVMVAHETAVHDEATGGFERLPWTGTNNPALGAKLMAMVDVIAYCGVAPPAEAGGQSRYMAQLINGNGRRGGDRFDALGPARTLDISEWTQAIHALHTQPPVRAQEAVAV